MSTSKEETPGTQGAALDMLQEWDGPANRSLLLLIIEVRRLRALLPEAFEAGAEAAWNGDDMGGNVDDAYAAWLAEGGRE